MKRIQTVTLYDCLTNVDIRFVQEAEGQETIRRVPFQIRRLSWMAAVLVVLLLCGFAGYRTGIFDPWFQKPSVSPIDTVQTAIENQIKKGYTINVRIEEIAVDQEAIDRAKYMYKGSELARENGWTDLYLEENLTVIRAAYYVEYDHTKTFQEDGEIEQFFILLRDEKTRKWKIWDNTTSGDPFL